MNGSEWIGKIRRYAASRLALNLYFWVFLLITKAQDTAQETAYSQGFYHLLMLGYALFFIFLAYLNNLVLLPKLWFKGRRWIYWGVVLPLVFGCSIVYVWLMKMGPVIFPGLNVMRISMVMSPVTTDTSFSGVLNDLETYFYVMLVWVIVHTLIGNYRNGQRQLRQMKEAANKHRETELAFLKSQMNPHFLFNTLNNLYGLALSGSAETPEYILKLSSVLRYVLYDADAALVSFQKEKEVIQAYIDIELLRLGEMKDAEFSISADREYTIPPLVWLPVLENAFKYTRGLEEPGIRFVFRILKGEMYLSCFNRKLPHKDDRNVPGGIGLNNLRTRLELLYPGRFSISREESELDFEIRVTIKLSEK